MRKSAEEAGILSGQVGGGVPVVEKPAADGEEFPGCFDPADLVFELRGVPLHNIGEVFLHFLHVLEFVKTGRFPGNFVIKEVDVFEHHVPGDAGNFLLLKCGFELGKNPGMPDCPTSDHQSGRPGLIQIVESGGDVDDIAIGDDGAREALDGLPNGFRMNGSLVAFLDGATVDGEEIDGMFFEDAQEVVKLIGRVETDPGFDGEGQVSAGLPQDAKKVVDMPGIAEESASGILAIDHGSRAPEIEVDAGNGVLFEFMNGADQFVRLLANHLGNDGAAGGVLGDGAEDVGLKIGMDVDPEIFRNVNVRASQCSHDAEEGEVGHVLHGREKKSRTMIGEHTAIKGKEGGSGSVKFASI